MISRKKNNIDPLKYELYNKCEQEYKNIVNAYHNAFAAAQCDPEKSNNWPQTYNQYYEKIHIALEYWKCFGHKNEIEALKNKVGSAINISICGTLIMNSFIPIPAILQ